MRFINWLDRHDIKTYDDLWEWSVDEVAAFWDAIWKYFAIQTDATPLRSLASSGMPTTHWFDGTTLSYAEHVFRDKADDQVAICFETEDGTADSWTWAQLRSGAAAAQARLVEMGVGRGDYVVGILPSGPEAIAAFLATAALGAVWSGLSPGLGHDTLAARCEQLRPSAILIGGTGPCGARRGDLDSTVERILQTIRRATTICSGHFPETRSELGFTRVPFSDPLCVLHEEAGPASVHGTVHSHGGLLLEHLKFTHFHFDVKQGDRVYWDAPAGSALWHLVLGVLLTGATVVTYDCGSAQQPPLDRFLHLVAGFNVTHLGITPAMLEACSRSQVVPLSSDVSAIITIGLSGLPRTQQAMEWLQAEFGPSVWPFLIHPSAQLGTAIAGGTLLKPLWMGEFQARCLGCKVEAFDPAGVSIVEEDGDLVITEPMPSMPISIPGDPDGRLLEDLYLSTFPGVWSCDELVRITDRGTLVPYEPPSAPLDPATR